MHARKEKLGTGESRAVRKYAGTVNHSADVHGLLARLDKAKRTGQGRWIACCPAHQDKHPSLSIRETDDGTILLKCWAGCGAADVVAAIGMTLADLFPNRPDDYHHKPIKKGQRWIPRDVIEALASEALIAALAADEVARGAALSASDVDRTWLAAGRLRAAAKEVGCYDGRIFNQSH